MEGLPLCSCAACVRYRANYVTGTLLHANVSRRYEDKNCSDELHLQKVTSDVERLEERVHRRRNCQPYVGGRSKVKLETIFFN